MLDEVLIVAVDEAPAVTEAGLNAALAPAGRPLAEKVTVCAAPPVTAVETVVEAEPPAVTLPEVGEAATEKSLPVEQVASLPATFTAVQAAWTALYSVLQRRTGRSPPAGCTPARCWPGCWC